MSETHATDALASDDHEVVDPAFDAAADAPVADAAEEVDASVEEAAETDAADLVVEVVNDAPALDAEEPTAEVEADDASETVLDEDLDPVEPFDRRPRGRRDASEDA